MARVPSIRITKNDRSKFSKLVNRAKSKIKRVEKNYGIDLREEIDLPSIESFETRKEFNEWIQKVSSFTNRNNLNYQFKKNKYGVVTSKAFLNKLEREIKSQQRKADEELKRIQDKPYLVGGKQYGTIGERIKMYGHPEDFGVYRPRDFNFNDIRSQDYFEERVKNTRNRMTPSFYDERSERLKRNFMFMLQRNFNSDAIDVIDKIDSIPPDIFYDLFLQLDEINFGIEYYPEKTHDYAEKNPQIVKLEHQIDQYFLGNIPMDMKDF